MKFGNTHQYAARSPVRVRAPASSASPGFSGLRLHAALPVARSVRYSR